MASWRSNSLASWRSSLGATVRRDFDSPWKHVCDHFFPEMLALVVPVAHQEINWTQPYRMRDKELPKPHPAYETGTRYADKLIEVQLKNGGQKHIFIHIEFQN